MKRIKKDYSDLRKGFLRLRTITAIKGKKITVILFLFILLLWTIDYGLSTSFADIPKVISYQGKLLDSQNRPITGAINITFKIYDAESGGAPLWTENYAGLAIDKGIFNVLLGGTTPLNLSFDKPYWLGIQAGSDPEMTPRQRLASAGYAYRAETVETTTIPFYRSGFGVEYVDSRHIRVAPGAIDISGYMLTAADYSAAIAIDDRLNYIEGAASPPNSWVYVYLYSANGSVGYKLSANFPNKADHKGNIAGQKRYYTPDASVYYRCVGWFYNDSGGNVREVGNVRESDAANIVKAVGVTDIYTSSTTYVDMPGMEIRFVSSGRPVLVLFTAPLGGYRQAENGYYTINIDGTDKATGIVITNDASYAHHFNCAVSWLETLSAGTHTIKMKWRCSNGALYQYGGNNGARILTVQEL